ncbi:hypothetical protein C8R44DRAFT_738069 [Mycena epipterygia]|nr:hypothetical protein C8R44DRAFT_738069 [Mycena epipterygia]
MINFNLFSKKSHQENFWLTAKHVHQLPFTLKIMIQLDWDCLRVLRGERKIFPPQRLHLFERTWKIAPQEEHRRAKSSLQCAIIRFSYQNRPLGYHNMERTEWTLTKAVCRSIQEGRANWSDRPIPIRLYPTSGITNIVDTAGAIGALIGRAEQRRCDGAPPNLSWSLDAQFAQRLQSYAGVLHIIYTCLKHNPPATVNVSWSCGARKDLAFGSTIGGRRGAKEKVRQVRLSDLHRAFPDILEFPEPVRFSKLVARNILQSSVDVLEYSTEFHGYSRIFSEAQIIFKTPLKKPLRKKIMGVRRGHCAENVAWVALRIREVTENDPTRISTLALTVRKLIAVNARTGNTFLYDLIMCRRETDYWAVMKLADALRACCENCVAFVPMLVPPSSVRDVAVERGGGIAIRTEEVNPETHRLLLQVKYYQAQARLRTEEIAVTAISHMSGEI